MAHLFSALQSVVAAFFGVQSEHKRQLDFQQPQLKHLIFIAIVLFILFVLAIYTVVFWVLNT